MNNLIADLGWVMLILGTAFLLMPIWFHLSFTIIFRAYFAERSRYLSLMDLSERQRQANINQYTEEMKRRHN